VPETPEARSALDSVGRPAALLGRDLWLRERAEGTITHLEGPRPGPALTGCLAALGIPDLPPPGSSAGRADRLLPIGLASGCSSPRRRRRCRARSTLPST
jgi:hypothetical protein